MVLPASSLRKFASSPKLNFPANIATPSHLNQHSHTSVYNLGGNKPLSRATSKATSMMNLKATSMVNLKVKDCSRFLCELGMKLHVWNLVEIIIFSLYHVIARPSKISNNLLKDCKILIFKVIFQDWNSVEFFWFFVWRILDLETIFY